MTSVTKTTYGRLDGFSIPVVQTIPNLKGVYVCVCVFVIHALYPLGPVATLRFCHLRPRCVSKQRRTTNVIISDRVWWIWCDAGLAIVATRPQRSPHSVASNSRPDYFAATRSRSLFLTINECCVSAAAAAIWEIQWRRSTPQLAPVDTGGDKHQPDHEYI